MLTIQTLVINTETTDGQGLMCSATFTPLLLSLSRATAPFFMTTSKTNIDPYAYALKENDDYLQIASTNSNQLEAHFLLSLIMSKGTLSDVFYLSLFALRLCHIFS